MLFVSRLRNIYYCFFFLRSAYGCNEPLDGDRGSSMSRNVEKRIRGREGLHVSRSARRKLYFCLTLSMCVRASVFLTTFAESLAKMLTSQSYPARFLFFLTASAECPWCRLELLSAYNFVRSAFSEETFY